MSYVSFDPVFGWVVAIVLALIMLASLWLTLTADGLTWRARSILVMIRLVAMVVLLLGWLRPGLTSQTMRENDGAIGVLLDRSQSMTMASGITGKSRWDVLKEVWKSIEQHGRGSLGKTKLVPYAFDSGIVALSSGSDLGLVPSGPATDLGSVLAEVRKTQQDPPLRGVILVTDATQTVFPVKLDAAQIAQQMAQLEQPVAIIGIGPRGDTSLRDIAVEGVPEHIDVFAKNRVAIPTIIHAIGVQNQPIRLNVTLKATGQPNKRIGTREVAAKQSDERMSMQTQLDAPSPGEYLLEVSATAEVNEIVKGNNSAMTFLTVREGGARILYIEGEARYEVKFLKRSLNASFDFQVESEWVSEKKRRTQLRRELPDLQSYDAIILGDLPADALSDAALLALRRRVEAGAGLMLVGGYHSFDAGGYGNSPLANVVPFTMQLGRKQTFDQRIDESFHFAGPLAIRPNRPHPITTLGSPTENQQLWSTLPPLLGANRFGKLKAAAEILLVGDKNEPILVAGEAGQGRVLAFAGDSTYLWYMHGEELKHKQFWRQCMLWLLRRDALQKGFRLTMESRRVMLGDEPVVGIEWFGGTDGQPMPEQMRIELYRDDTWQRVVTSNPVRENRREAKLSGLTEKGLYRIKLAASDRTNETFSAELVFIVREESRELSSPMADWQTMENIAAASKAVGGRIVAPDDNDIKQLIDQFRDRQQKLRVPVVETRKLGDAAWDSWLYLIIFSAVMALEWGLRKSWLLP